MTTRMRARLPAGRTKGVIALPDRRPAPGVMVLHEIQGLDRSIKDACDRLADAGYAAYAPDIYSRGFKPFCIIRTLRALARNDPPPIRDLTDMLQWLRSHPATLDDAVGVMGFCMGGGFALSLAVANDATQVASVNYGGVPNDIDDVRGACPVVASYGALDERFSADGRRLDLFLDELGIDHDVRIYEGATHSFMNNHHGALAARLFGVRFHPEAADHAWLRTLEFFGRHLDTDGRRIANGDGSA